MRRAWHLDSAVASLAIGTIAPGSFLFLPLVIAAYIGKVGLSGEQAGYVVAADLAGMALSIILAQGWLHRLSWRRVTCAASVLLCAANLLTCLAQPFTFLLVERFAGGLAAGAVSAICTASLATHAKAGRWFALLVTAQFMLSAAGMLILPAYIGDGGIAAIFAPLAAMALMMYPLAYCLRQAEITTKLEVAESSSRRSVTWAEYALIGIAPLVYFLGANAFWTYVEQLGSGAGLGIIPVGEVLALSAVFSALGAVVATATSEMIDPAVNCLVGLTMTAFALVLAEHVSDYSSYRTAVCLFALGWTYTWPYLLAVAADLDPTGRLSVSANAAAWAGLAIGPIAAAQLQASRSPVELNNVLALTCTIVAFGFIGGTRCVRLFRNMRARRAQA